MRHIIPPLSFRRRALHALVTGEARTVVLIFQLQCPICAHIYGILTRAFYITLNNNNNNDNLIPRTPLTLPPLHQQPTNPQTHLSTTDPTPRRRTRANVPHFLRIRLVGIFSYKDFADERLHVRRRGGQIDGAGGLLGAEGEGAGDGAVDDVDAGLVDGAAGGVAEEVVLRGDDHGGLGSLFGEGGLEGEMGWGGRGGLRS